MKRFIPLLLLLAAPAQADIAIKHTQSASLKVDGAAVQAIRVPSTYAVSGNNMKVTTGEHFGKLTAGTGVDVSAGVVADMPAFGNTVVTSGGVAGNLAGTVTSAGLVTITAGGAGTTATAQSSSEITVK